MLSVRKSVCLFSPERIVKFLSMRTHTAVYVSREPQQPTTARKDVVTAFVRRSSDGSVLLVQRSDQVGTYRLQWGGVSGGVEGRESLVHRCLQEMHEEVGLQEDQVQLVRSGRPLFVDSGRLHFTVHPFLFHLTDPEARVRLNWENVDHAWVQPAGIRSLDTVPLLAETYMRVEVLPLLRPHLDRLQRDREHGAVQLACWVLDALQELGKQLRGQEGGDLPGEGREALQVLLNQGYHLGEVRPSMAPLVNVAAAVLGAVRAELAGSAGAAPSLQEVWREVGKAIQQERDALRQSSRRVRAAVLELLREGMTVMTTSYSSTVEDALREGSARGLRLSVIVCEARPLCEGVQLANSLAGAGVGTTLITDAQAAVFMEQANLVLVGADTLTQRHVINKAGTHLLALAAAARGVPLYVAASSCKLSPGPLHDVAHAGGQEGAAPSLEEAEAGEVVASWQSLLDSRVTVRNVYFEATPLELVTGIVTEEGLLEPAQAVQQIEELKQLYIDAFQLSPLV